MKSKTVIVTGASSGIGKAIARLFWERGYHVVLNATGKEALAEVVASFGSSERTATVAGDISLKATGKALAAEALARFGSIDVLVNNAGVFAPKPFLDVEEEDLDRFYNINLKGTFFTTQAVVPHLKEAGGGAVINIGTVLVDHAIAGFPASAPVVSKGGIHALTRQLAAEFGKDNIRVNTLAPGIIRSPLQAKNGISDADGLKGLHLLDRIGETEEVAEAAWLLAESTFITGEVLNVDGGHVAGHTF